MKKLISTLLVLNILLLAGCAGDDSSSGKKTHTARKAKKVLSEAEKAKLITPTIYYISDYSAETECVDTAVLNLKKSKNNIVKISVCRKALKGCAMQGSCYIKLDDKKVMINYHEKVNGTILFVLVDRSVCEYGLGDSSDPKQSFKIMCLDPFYSVAADTAIYPLGTVIYIPAVRGIALPGGSNHDGYFVVRDSGGNIDGHGRFDFFTGDFGLNARNPFSNLGLGGESNFEYEIVPSSDAQGVRERRKFPYLK